MIANDSEKNNKEVIIVSKTFECPVCEKNFENYCLRPLKTKLLKTDSDLKAYYEPCDPIYYDVLVCPFCGYSSLASTFNIITDRQISLIKTEVSSKFKPRQYHEIYTPDDAINRYKLALLCAMVKNTKHSEKALLCLRIAWILRDKGSREEMDFLQKALESFAAAYDSETTFLAGLDENTVAYLIAELSRRLGKLSQAQQYVSQLALSRNLPPRLKERVYDLKEQIKSEMKKV